MYSLGDLDAHVFLSVYDYKYKTTKVKELESHVGYDKGRQCPVKPSPVAPSMFQFHPNVSRDASILRSKQ
jgi:hypothetical protein